MEFTETGFEKDTLVEIRTLGTEARRLEEEMARRAEELQSLKAKHTHIIEQLLPDLMLQAGVDEIKLADGTKILREDVIYANFPVNDEALRKRILGYIDEVGASAIVKNTLAIDRDEAANEILERITRDLEDLGIGFKVRESVHPQTYLKFVREQIEQNPDFPKEDFKIHEGSRVKFKN